MGRHIRSLREAAGLTLTQVQEMTGVDRSDLSKIENGKRRMNRSDSRDPLVRIAQALDADPVALLVMAGHTDAASIGRSRNAKAEIEKAIARDPDLSADDRAFILAAIRYVRAARSSR